MTKKQFVKEEIIIINGFEISTEKVCIKRYMSIEDAEKHLNILGYTRFLNMIDKNYMYENDEFIAYIQDVNRFRNYLQNQKQKKVENAEQNIEKLIEFLKVLI